MHSDNTSNTAAFGEYRILIISVSVGIIISTIMLSVWFNVKSKLDQSNVNLVATEAGIIKQKIVSEIELLTIQNNNPLTDEVLTNAFDRILNSNPELFIEILDNQGRIIYSGENRPYPPPEYSFSVPIEINTGNSEQWIMKVSNTPVFLENHNFRFIYVGLVIAMSLSVLLAFAVFSVQKLNQNSKELNLLNDQLVEEREKADQASLAKTEFLSNMSHEIRTPISVILGFLSLMKSEKLTTEQKNYVQLMETSSKSLLSIVNDVLEVDKIEAGEVTLAEVEFSPLQELSKMVEIQKTLFDEKGLYLKLNAPDEDIFVIGDPVKFHQISTNLIRNAFKFTEKGGLEITLNYSKKAKKTELDIQFTDSGIGIPEEKLKGIFDRFSQVDSSYKRKHEGTGLGLAITLRLAEAMGGTIEVVSESGKGTSFHVHLTFKPASGPYKKMIIPEESSEFISFSGKNVLIVDDHYVNIVVIKKFLEKYQINAKHVESGADAIQEVIQNTYDLIFMDVHMPEMDGLEATRKIRALDLNTPIVGLSADVTKSAIESARESGMDDYLSKPFSRDKLEDVFHRFLAVKEKS